MSRQKDNLEILNRLREYVATSPDERFGQILRNIGIINDYRDEEDGLHKWANHFNEEPSDMLKRMDERKHNAAGFFVKPKRTKK
jgi:hypothetical protein